MSKRGEFLQETQFFEDTPVIEEVADRKRVCKKCGLPRKHCKCYKRGKDE